MNETMPETIVREATPSEEAAAAAEAAPSAPHEAATTSSPPSVTFPAADLSDPSTMSIAKLKTIVSSWEDKDDDTDERAPKRARRTAPRAGGESALTPSLGGGEEGFSFSMTTPELTSRPPRATESDDAARETRAARSPTTAEPSFEARAAPLAPVLQDRFLRSVREVLGEGEEEEEEEEKDGREKNTDGSSKKKKKRAPRGACSGSLLVVDDSLAARRFVQRTFEARGYRVDTCQNGWQAFAQMKNRLYDLVFLDIEMPVMNGYRCAQALRRWEREVQRPESQVICALTSHATPDERELGQGVGMNYYEPKPARPRRLLDIVDRCLNENASSSGGASGGGDDRVVSSSSETPAPPESAEADKEASSNAPGEAGTSPAAASSPAGASASSRARGATPPEDIVAREA